MFIFQASCTIVQLESSISFPALVLVAVSVKITIELVDVARPACGTSATWTHAMQAADCITKGQEKYNAGDRMGALRFFEQSLKKVCTATPECFMISLFLSPTCKGQQDLKAA